MTGAEAWSLVAPMIFIPGGNPHTPQAQAMIDAYVTVHIGLTLFDNWVANGKPEAWREKPGKEKKK